MNKFSVLVFLLLDFYFEVSGEEGITVTVENGKMIGLKNAGFHAFKGIPYAKPPVGNLRFEPPQRYDVKWKEVKTFDFYGPKCAQFNHFGYVYDGKEDCLHLNVYVPNSIMEQPAAGGVKKAGVIFFMHGGQFMFGNSKMYGPENFMQREIILVTIQYRVGPLGFLSAEDKDLPGNLGLKDQVAALEWVKRNIEAFNGDPNKVTLSGFSSGAASVQLHYISALSDGLFQNGVSHSGVAINPWVMQDSAKEKFNRLVETMNCPLGDTKKAVACLKTVHVRDIVMFATKYQKVFYLPISPFGVVVEPKQKGAFITEHPLESLKNGRFQKLPWILSQTIDEGLYPAAELHDYQYMISIQHRWQELCPFLLDINATKHTCEFKQIVCQKVKNFYFNETRISYESFGRLREIFTERFQHHGALRAAEYQGKFSPTYMYLFMMPTYNFIPIGHWTDILHDDVADVTHGDDVFLLYFYIGSRGPEGDPYQPDEKAMSKDLIEMYINFNKNSSAIFDGTFLPNCNPKVAMLEIYEPKDFDIVEDLENFGNITFWESLKIDD